MTEMEIYNENLARLKEIAAEKGYELNRDRERLVKVAGLMTRNIMEFGKPYCPCKQSHPLNPETDTLCPCNELEAEIDNTDHCFCRLFFKTS